MVILKNTHTCKVIIDSIEAILYYFLYELREIQYDIIFIIS